MRILITGSAGFIGTNFTKYWLDNYAEDTVIGVLQGFHIRRRIRSP